MGSDDAETVKRIEQTVLDILQEMDMPAMVRAAAAERLGMDLSVQHRMTVVQRVIDSFLQSLDCDEEEEEAVVLEEEEEQDQVREGEEKIMEVEEEEVKDEEKQHQVEEEEEEEEGSQEEEEEYEHDDAETMERIEETVWEILKGADMNSMTGAMVSAAASKRLGLDLSVQHRKEFVRSVIDSFLIWLDYNEEKPAVVPDEAKEEERKDQAQEREEEEKEEEGKMMALRKREYECDDSGDPIICALSSKRRVTLQEFRGKMLVSIREFCEKDGKQLPTSKGMSLTVEQWEVLRKAVPRIEDAIKQLGGSID